MNTKSIYEILYDSLTPEGRLPKDFILSIEAPVPNELQFMPGAKDGIGMFAFESPQTKRAAKKIVKLLKRDWKKRSDSQVKIAALLRKHGTFLIDPVFCRALRDNIRNLSMEDIKAYACRLAFASADEDLVKLGIALFGLVDLTQEKDIIDKLLVLALYGEFTLYAAVVFANMENGNDLLFTIAQKVDGWGKIQVVTRLEARSAEIREWILRHGCETGFMDSYLGLTCARKGNLIEILRGEALDDALFDSIGIIIVALLEGDPVDGFSDYEYGSEALLRYLQFAAKQAVTVAHLWRIMHVLLLIDQSGIENREALQELCENIINRPVWQDLLFKILENPNHAEFHFAIHAASRLELDIMAPVFEAILKDPIKHGTYAHLLYGHPEYLSQLVDLYEAILPLEEMASGMGDYLFADTLRQEHWCLSYMVHGLGDYPGMGRRLVQTALRSPVVRERNFACQVLQSWEEQMGEPLGDLWPELFSLLGEIAPTEVNFETKTEMYKLLGKRPPLAPGTYKRVLLVIPQILLVAVTLFLFFRLWNSGGVHVWGADMARAVLEGYLVWHREIFHLSVIAVLVVLVGNVLLIRFGRAKGLLVMKHLAFALAGFILVLSVVIVVNVSTPTRAVQDDIRAIARHERDSALQRNAVEQLALESLQTRIIQNRISTRHIGTIVVPISADQAMTRLSHMPGPSSAIHPTAWPWVIHRVSLNEAPYAVYFSRALAGELEQLVRNGTEDEQLFEIRYTPNLRLVLTFRLIDPLAEERRLEIPDFFWR